MNLTSISFSRSVSLGVSSSASGIIGSINCLLRYENLSWFIENVFLCADFIRGRGSIRLGVYNYVYREILENKNEEV